MIARSYKIPSKSFFLFGPRGVGKSTWIKELGGYALRIDLLRHATFLELNRDPSLLEAQTKHLQKGDVVFIDEIQKIPELLDEVHRLMEDKGLEFILTGSSARKLKRIGINLLAGRAHTYKMYPLTLRELGTTYPIDELLKMGTLPIVLRDPNSAQETLASYVDTYLKEEIREEALVRKISDFQRFLTIAGNLNSGVINFQSVARDSGKSGATIQSWFQILEETLLGSFVPAYRPGFKVREVAHPKFYWFDPAVARTAAGLSENHIDSLSQGSALETLVLQEIKVYLEVTRQRMNIYYYATQGVGEIDFIIETRPKTTSQTQQFISVEVKLAQKWRRDFEGPSRALMATAGKSHQKMIGVYLGTERLTFDNFEVFPLMEFVSALYAGELLPPHHPNLTPLKARL